MIVPYNYETVVPSMSCILAAKSLIFKILNGHYQRLHTSFYIDRLTLLLSSKSGWLNAKTIACHLGDPGSIPGEGNFLLIEGK